MSKKAAYNKLQEHQHTGNWLFNIRGTNGSGKSTTARAIMDMGTDKIMIQEGPKSKVYEVIIGGKPVYFLGAYETACGGLDAIANFDEVRRLALKYIEKGHVVMEGILWSTVFKSSYELDEQLRSMGHSMLWLQINTDIGTCIDRVVNRRVSSCNYNEFDPTNMVAKQNSISRTFNKAIDHGALCVLGSGDDLAHIAFHVIRERLTLDPSRTACHHFVDPTLSEYKDAKPIQPPQPVEESPVLPCTNLFSMF